MTTPNTAALTAKAEHSPLPFEFAINQFVHVSAHGEIAEDFQGRVVGLDADNYLVFVCHADTGTVWSCSQECVV